jgi:solute carrier family 15 (peptide/histidine transporter), member 3/4
LLLQGLALLTIQAHYPSLKPKDCNVNDITAHCKTPSQGQEAILFIGLYLLAFGSAGTKAALPSHGADQFDESDPKEEKKMSTFFNILLLAVCMGGAVSLTFIVWIQINKGWDWGFGIGTIAIFLGTVIFAAGLPLYRIQLATGNSVLLEIIQVSSYLGLCQYCIALFG